jgi:hypothetical protein
MPKAPSPIIFLVEKFLVAVSMVARSIEVTVVSPRGISDSIPTGPCDNLLLLFMHIMKARERKMTAAAHPMHMAAITAAPIFLLLASSAK